MVLTQSFLQWDDWNMEIPVWIYVCGALDWTSAEREESTRGYHRRVVELVNLGQRLLNMYISVGDRGAV